MSLHPRKDNQSCALLNVHKPCFWFGVHAIGFVGGGVRGFVLLLQVIPRFSHLWLEIFRWDFTILKVDYIFTTKCKPVLCWEVQFLGIKRAASMPVSSSGLTPLAGLEAGLQSWPLTLVEVQSVKRNTGPSFPVGLPSCSQGGRKRKTKQQRQQKPLLEGVWQWDRG